MIGRTQLRTRLGRALVLENDDVLQQTLLKLLAHAASPGARMYSSQALNWLRITASEVPLLE